MVSLQTERIKKCQALYFYWDTYSRPNGVRCWNIQCVFLRKKSRTWFIRLLLLISVHNPCNLLWVIDFHTPYFSRMEGNSHSATLLSEIITWLGRLGNVDYTPQHEVCVWPEQNGVFNNEPKLFHLSSSLDVSTVLSLFLPAVCRNN